MEEMEQAYQLIADYCGTNQQLTFVDVFTPMLNSDHRPRAE